MPQVLSTCHQWLLQVGGIGFIHYNSSLEEQTKQVAIAKNHTPGFVVHPVVMAPINTVADLYDLKVHKWDCAHACRQPHTVARQPGPQLNSCVDRKGKASPACA